jgi:hypothetical protein
MHAECMCVCVCVWSTKATQIFEGAKGDGMICPSVEKDNLVRKMWGGLYIKLSLCWQILNKN